MECCCVKSSSLCRIWCGVYVCTTRILPCLININLQWGRHYKFNKEAWDDISERDHGSKPIKKCKRQTAEIINCKFLNTHSLLSILNTLSSKWNLVKIKCLVVKHITLPFIPAHNSKAKKLETWKPKSHITQVEFPKQISKWQVVRMHVYKSTRNKQTQTKDS